MDKQSRTDKNILSSEGTNMDVARAVKLLTDMERRSGTDLEKMPLVIGDKYRVGGNLKDLYVPRTVRQVPRKTLNALSTVLNPAVPLDILMAGAQEGDFYIPSLDVVRTKGVSKHPGTLAHEVGHWMDHNYPKNISLDRKDPRYKALNPTLRKEVAATRFAQQSMSPSEWANRKKQLTKALATYLVFHPRPLDIEAYKKKHGKRSLKELHKGDLSVKEYRRLLKSLLVQAAEKDKEKAEIVGEDSRGTIRMKAPAHEALADALLNVIGTRDDK